MSILSRFKKSEYAKHSAILMGGTVASMLMKTLTGLVMADLLGDALFGEYSLYSATYSILLIPATCRYELAVMLPKNDSDGFLVSMLSSCLAIIFSVVLTAILLLAQLFVHISMWLWFMPITLAVLGVYYSVNYWLNRKKNYIKLAVNRVLQGIMYLVCSFACYHIEPLRQYSLIMGYLLSQSFVMIILIIYAVRDYRRYRIVFSFSRIKELALEYINFPKLSTVSGIINNLAVKLPIYLLKLFEGSSAAGQYGLMESVLAAPISLISEAIRDVFRQKASHDYNQNGECSSVYKTTFKTLALSAIIPFALIMIGGIPVLNLLYGEMYRMAGVFILIMTPFYYIRFIVSPLTFMTYIANRQGFDMKWQMLFCVASLVGFFVGYAISQSVYVMLVMYGITTSVMYAFNYRYTRRLSKGNV